MITNGDADYVTTAQIIMNDLEAIGINVEIINYDQASYYSMISDVSNYDIALYATAAPTLMAVDIFNAYLTFFTCGWEGPEREEYMALAAQAAGISDDTERANALAVSSKMLAEFSPWYGICDKLSLEGVNKGLQNTELTVNGQMLYAQLTWAS
jgi:ABC-type transport system substrate-binding protein